MTEPKTLTPQEALRALADGKRLTKKGWDGWIELNGEHIVSSGAGGMRLLRIIVNYSAFITTPIWLPITFWYVMISGLIEGDKSIRATATGKEWYWE